MEERHFNWGYLSLFIGGLLVLLAIRQWNSWQDRRKRRAARGFRGMKSSGRVRSGKSRKGNWRR